MKTEIVRLKRILATTDFSRESLAAFPAAADIARKFGAELHIAHFLERIPTDVFLTPDGVQTYSPEVDYARKFRDLLGKVAAEEPSFSGLTAKTHLLEGGTVADRLAHFEREHRIDLTVISSSGRSAIGHLLLGSFAEKVVRTARSPVIVWTMP